MLSLQLSAIKTIFNRLDHPSEAYGLRGVLPKQLIKLILLEGSKLIEWSVNAFEYVHPIEFIDDCEDFDSESSIQDHFKFNIANSKQYIRWLTSSCLCRYIKSSAYHMWGYYYQCDGEITYACLKCLKLIVFLNGVNPRNCVLNITHDRVGVSLIIEQLVKKASYWCRYCKRTPLFELKLGSECLQSNKIIHVNFEEPPPSRYLYRVNNNFCWSRKVHINWLE